MRDGVFEVGAGQEILILARPGSAFRFPRELLSPTQAQLMLPRLLAMPDAMQRIRAYCSETFVHHLDRLTDHDLIRMVEHRILSGQLQAVVLQRAAPAHMQRRAAEPSQIKSGLATGLTQVGQPAAGNARAAPGIASATISPEYAVAGGPSTQSLSVTQWTLEDRIAEVLRRTISKLPKAIGATLLSLVSKENIEIAAGMAAVGAAANLTPYGWVVDAIVVGIAFGLGGVAAVHALGDLFDCCRRIVNAKSLQDLDFAADALARAIVAFGAVGFMVILHRFATRRSGGVAGPNAAETEQVMSPSELRAARSERLKARAKAHQENARAQETLPEEVTLPKEVQRMPQAFQDEYLEARANGWKHPDGSTWYPPNNGAVGTPVRTGLEAGAKIDRFGAETGSYTSPAGQSLESRALPKVDPNTSAGKCREYVVTPRGKKYLMVEKAEIAPWFDQPGGGTQYRLIDSAGNSMSVRDAVANGLLEESE